jgi:hypothetical protein
MTLDAAQVEALPFVDLAELRARVEQTIDMPMYWTIEDAKLARVLGGYQEKTQVRIRTKIVSYTYDEVDPALCAGGSCPLEGDPVGLPCRSLLRIGIESELRTADGAVEATLVGEAAKWGPGSAVFGDTASEITSYSAVDLRDARGTLRLGSAGPTARSGELTLEITYGTHRTTGTLAPTLIFEEESPGVSLTTYEAPLVGEWPERSNVQPPTAGRE